MLPDQLVIIAFLFAVISGMALNMLDLIGTSLYDLGQVKKQKMWLKHPNSKRFRHKPLISVIIPAHNEESVIERCLDSILKSSYRKLEIIVVDDASSDGTSSVVKQYIKDHSKRTIKLVSKRKNAGRGGALNAGFKTHAKGELIMALDADSTLTKHALRNTVRHFAMEDITALAANVRIMDYPSIIGLLQQFEYLASFRSKKLNTISNSEYIVGGSGAVYTRKIFTKLKGFNESMWTEDIALSLAIAKLGNKKFRLYYASDVVIYTEPVLTYKSLFRQRYRWKLGSLQALFANKSLFFTVNADNTKFLTWFRLPMVIWGELLLLLEPFLISYFIYLAIAFHKPILYGISWAAVSFLLAFAVWGDDQLPIRKKFRMTLFIPIMYNLLYVMTFIQIGAMFKSVFNYRKITGKTVIRGSWKPPERIVQQQGSKV